MNDRTPNRRLAIKAGLITLVVVGVLVALVVGQRKCSKRGGTYVRGLFTMECINAKH